MSKINVTADILAKLKHFSDSGEVGAVVLQAICDGTKVLTLTVGVEATNVINIAGQVSDLDGTPPTAAVDLLITSTPQSGAGTMVIHGGIGTAKVGSGTKSLWLATTAAGAFSIDVTNAAAEDNLISFQLDNGQVEAVKLTYT